MRCFSQILLFVSMLLAAGCNNGPPPAFVVGHVSDNKRLDKAGEQAEWAIRLALHELDKDGALADTFAGKKIQVHHTDTRGEIDAFESQAVRLFNFNRSVAILGGLSAKEVSSLDHVKGPILTFHGQPVAGASNHVFYLGMSPRRQGEVLASVLAEDKKLKRVAIIQDERRTEGVALVDAFQKKMEEARPGSVTTVPIRFNTILPDKLANAVDWPEVIERTISAAPQAVVFVGNAKDFNQWHRASEKDDALSGLKVVFAGSDGEQRLFDFEGKSSVLIATAYYADPGSELVKKFQDAYRALPPKTEPDVHAALAFDGMRMLVDAMKRVGPQSTPEKMREELLKELPKTKDFAGLNGPLTITPERQVTRPLFVMRWEGGKLAHVKSFP